MTHPGTPSDGARHLAVLARGPRAAGSEGERLAREYATSVLRNAGFDVAIEAFDYSAFPGRWGTPLGSVLAMVTVLATVWVALGMAAPRGAIAVLVAGFILLGVFARRMLGDGVLLTPWMRASAVNVVARRDPNVMPRVWLVAHLDSKSQPVPSALRVAGIVVLASGMVVSIAAAAVTLASGSSRTLWWIAALLATCGAIPAMLSVVGNDSDGAVDNASGVAAVLSAAVRARRDSNVGVLLPSAEELGLAGARAWVRARRGETGVALNCDGVDDDGELTIMFTGTRPDSVVQAIDRAADRAPRVRRMPLGLLTDSVALADGGWRAVTVSRGSLRTLRRVHTRRDSLATLRGAGIDEVSTLLARCAEELAR